jgi:GT2 family glycosyltransferase
MTKVTIVVPVHNCPDLLLNCHEGLGKTRHPIHIVYVDNGSDAQTRDMLHRLDNCQVVYNTTNEGFSKAVNIGAKASKSSVIILYNQDCMNPNPCWVDNILELFKQRRACAVQGALLTYPNTRIIQHAGIVYPPGTSGMHIYENTSSDRAEVQESKQYAAVTGAVMAVRREVWDALGGFSEDYALDCEDSDFCLRVQKELHLQVWYNARVHVEHATGAVKKRTPTALEMMRASHDTFMARWDNYLRELPSAYTTFLR